jgi:hypothetical protein
MNKVNEDSTLYDKFKDSLDVYKSAYINYKTHPTSEKENHYFVSKQSLQNIYDKMMTSDTSQSNVGDTEYRDNIILSYNEKKKSLDKLKSTLENIQTVEDTMELSSNRKSHFFYFLKREQVFLLILLVLLCGFIVYSRYELKQSYEITKTYIKNKLSKTKMNSNTNTNTTIGN